MSSSSYSLRSLSGANLDSLLTSYGAATSGSTERKRERLQRFVNSQVDRDISDVRLANTRRNEQERVQTHVHARSQELRRSSRLAARESEICPSPSSAPAFSPVRRPTPPSLPSTQRMTTRSMTRAAAPPPPPRRTQDVASQRSAARAALQRIHEILAGYLA